MRIIFLSIARNLNGRLVEHQHNDSRQFDPAISLSMLCIPETSDTGGELPQKGPVILKKIHKFGEWHKILEGQ